MIKITIRSGFVVYFEAKSVNNKLIKVTNSIATEKL